MKKVIKLWDKIIVVLLGFLGVLNSCEQPEKYGMLMEEYKPYLNGIVTNKETSNPIQNIQIIGQYSDTAYTDAEGRYSFYNVSPNFHLKVEDIDGTANGGEFETQEIDVKFTQDDQIEGNQTGGKYVKTVNIELETKK